MTERLDRRLCERTPLSRKEAKAAIRGGRAAVNGITVTNADAHVGESDTVTLDGRPIAADRFVYIMLNKP